MLTKNQLKILAMVCMTIDHIGAMLFPQAVWLRVIGRLAFPLFSYCIAEGCRYTRNKARYFGSVFACGAVCVIAFLPFGGFYGNALITLSLSILLLYGVEAWKSSGKLRFLGIDSRACRRILPAVSDGLHRLRLRGRAPAGLRRSGTYPLGARVCRHYAGHRRAARLCGRSAGACRCDGRLCSASAYWRSFRSSCSETSAANGR